MKVILGTFELPNTNGWGSFQTIKIPDVAIQGGNSKIVRIEFISGGINLNWIKFTATNNGPNTNNLVKNPGFETGNLNSWGGFSAREVVNNNVNSGTFSAKVTGVAGLQQVITVKPNTTYTLSAQIKTQGGQGILGVKNYGGSEKGTGTTSSSYVLKTITFTTGNTNTIATIYLFVPGNGTIAFGDDFSVIEASGFKSEKLKHSLITLYPNPSNNKINISGIVNYNHITITDTLGRMVMQKQLYFQQETTIDISQLTPGKYFATVTNKDAKETYQFLRK